VRPEAPEALADAMRTLSGDPGLRRALGLAGRRFVERHFDKRAIVARWETLLAETVAGGPAW